MIFSPKSAFFAYIYSEVFREEVFFRDIYVIHLLVYAGEEHKCSELEH